MKRLQQIYKMFSASLLISMLIASPLVHAQVPEESTPITVTEQTTPPPAPTEEADATPPAIEPSATPAEAPTPAPPAPTPTPGPTTPSGPAASSYIYNEATGLWENDYYSWDPVTKQTKPKQATSYSYNPTTNRWETTEWMYDAPSGVYVPNVAAVSAPTEDARFFSPLTATALEDNNSTTLPGGSIYDLFYDATISSKVNSTAISGNASVLYNTLGGSATTGNAAAMANLISMMQSSWGGLQGDLTTFESTLYGDIFGDLLLDPARLKGSSLSVGPTIADDSELSVNGSALIDNTVRLNVMSGDATVANNTTGGNATSGDVLANANLINVINSSIGAGQNFLGVVNIMGNLDGDILLPDGFIDSLYASRAPTVGLPSRDIEAVLSDETSLDTQVSINASSGNATIANNTAAGNATSGDVDTNITVFNLTGRQVYGENSLLVFVNVLGEWVGIIVDAPNGTTAAALGSGLEEGAYGSLPSNIDANTSSAIKNDVAIEAHSGDATVSDNTKAGNATSGDVAVGVNVLNIASSQLSFKNWFGVLFINVFGSWNGSFGVDTAAGEAAGPGGQGGEGPRQATTAVASAKVYSMSTSADGRTRLARIAAYDEPTPPQEETAPQVASANFEAATDSSQPSVTDISLPEDAATSLQWLLWSLLGACAAALMIFRRYTRTV